MGGDNSVLVIAIIILLALGAIGVLAGLISLLGGSKSQRDRIDNYVRTLQPREAAPSGGKKAFDLTQLDDFRSWVNQTLGSLSSTKLKHRISSAYWPISDIEFVLIRVAGVGVGILLGWLISGMLVGGLALGALVYFVPGFLLQRSIVQRQKKFQEQLVDVLLLIRGAVQAGYGLLQSLDVVISEMSSPASEEFERVVREVQIGLSLPQALTNLANRMESDDLQLAVTAIIINTQVGGNLTTMLSVVTDTIRARYQLFGEVRALTSYARYAGYLLTFLPFGTGVAMFLLSPEYYAVSITTSITQIILGVALVLVIIGNIWLRQVAKIEV